MYNLIVKETEEEVLQHFNSLGIDGVGFETTTPKVVWKRNTPTHDYSRDYLTFISQQDGTKFKFSGSSTSNTLQYSLDNGDNWSTLAHNTDSPTVASGDTILFKASGLTITSSWGIGRFSSNNRFKVEGNVMSLVYGDDFVGQTSLEGKASVFTYLFYGSTGLTTAENLILPATTLANYCYRYIFSGCTSLTIAPELPATTLAEGCYQYMFWACTSLTTAPELPSTTLTDECYMGMFEECTSLTTAPELPASTLANYCYGYMFGNCTSLSTAPELPATTLTYGCYNSMFIGCTSLTAAPELPATTLTNYCYSEMFVECTSLTIAPELPATTLDEGCYYGMFSGCTSLTTAPELPATTLADECYGMMFNGCTSLNYIKCLATDISANNCIYDWVYDVAAPGTFVKAPSMDDWELDSSSGIPEGWTVVDAS